MRFSMCPNCQCDINASNDYRELPKYLKECNAFKLIPGVKDGCDYCVRETVESLAKQWLDEGRFEDVSRLLADYVGLVAP